LLRLQQVDEHLARRGDIVDDEHPRLAVGDRPPDGGDQIVEREFIVLQHVIDDIALHDLVARVEIECRGEDDCRDIVLDRAVERFTIGRIRQVEVDDGHGVAVPVLGKFLAKSFQRRAGFDGKAELRLESVTEHGGKHPGIFNQKYLEPAGAQPDTIPLEIRLKSHSSYSPMRPMGSTRPSPRRGR